jgi:hypothetical protein
MGARWIRILIVLLVPLFMGATQRTPNFVVQAPTVEIARAVATAAEQYRIALAQEWLGKELPRWNRPCVVTVRVGQIGAGGATTFSFDRGEVYGWKMRVQGSLERILDSVLPHEISHTIFACHFRRPLPRWADEGAATLVEHESERRRQHLLLNEVMSGGRTIPLRRLLSMTEYPRAMQSVLTLYAQGHSLADYLVQQRGKTQYLRFLSDAHRVGWNTALKQGYGIETVEKLESTWSSWVTAGSPALNLPAGQQLTASSLKRPSRDRTRLIVRGQSPDRSDIDTNTNTDTAKAPQWTDRTRPRGRDIQAPVPFRVVKTAASNNISSDSVQTADLNTTENSRLQRLSEAGWRPARTPRVRIPGRQRGLISIFKPK